MLRCTAAILDRALAGRQVVSSELRWPSVAGLTFDGRTFVGTRAYGKHLFTRFDDARTLHTHLRMDGAWRIEATGSTQAAARATTIRAVLASAAWTALGHRLGMLDVVPTRAEHTLIDHLGPDVLADDFPEQGLARALERWATRRSTPVADVLLDQTVAAGIGTIYTAESLFARHVWPWTPADDTDAATLLMTARTLMQRSIAAAGSTDTDAKVQRRTIFAHGRLGKPCLRCGMPIRVGQARTPPMERPVFYCPSCQCTPSQHHR